MARGARSLTASPITCTSPRPRRNASWRMWMSVRRVYPSPVHEVVFVPPEQAAKASIVATPFGTSARRSLTRCWMAALFARDGRRRRRQSPPEPHRVGERRNSHPTPLAIDILWLHGCRVTSGQSNSAPRSPSRILADHPWTSRIRPGVYRPFELVFRAPQTLQTRWLATSGTGSRFGNSSDSGSI